MLIEFLPYSVSIRPVGVTSCPLLPSGLPPKRFHVGDTPQDILAAVDAGVTAIGVATGIYTKEQLEAVAPGKNVVVLPGLQDVDQFLRVVGL